MDAPAQRQDSEPTTSDTEPEATVCCHETRPGKIVFTERDNTDGWIATNLAVDLEP